MLFGKVVGTVVASRKCEHLSGQKLLIVDELATDYYNEDRNDRWLHQRTMVAVDSVGAGVGEYVLVAVNHAFPTCGTNAETADAVIVGIVDQYNLAEHSSTRPRKKAKA